MPNSITPKGPAGGKVAFSSPSVTDLEKRYILESLDSRHLAGDGPFTKRCHAWLKDQLKVPHALLTHSCTAALEMAALLLDLQPGDEVIMPSYTFVSTANAVALRGAVPVFVDIRPDTLNIDESLIPYALTSKTKAIFVVHYAGVAAEMDTIQSRSDGIPIVEDAAQGLYSKYRGRPLGTIGEVGCLSFHETKNVVSGEGGALLTRSPKLASRAEIIREKGTNRSQFFRGQVDKYTWVDLGSSYLPSDLLAALLLAQLERTAEITAQRLELWERYNSELWSLESLGVHRPTIPPECEHNAHIFYLITRSLEERTALAIHLKDAGIQAPFHYVPLHSSPAAKRFSRYVGEMKATNEMSDRLIRLPLYAGLSEQDRIIERVLEFYKRG